MKINIKDVFEKQNGDFRVHTNDRLDVEEVFAEALADDRRRRVRPETEVEPENAQPETEAEPEAVQEEPQQESESDKAEARAPEEKQEEPQQDTENEYVPDKPEKAEEEESACQSLEASEAQEQESAPKPEDLQEPEPEMQDASSEEPEAETQDTPSELSAEHEAADDGAEDDGSEDGETDKAEQETASDEINDDEPDKVSDDEAASDDEPADKEEESAEEAKEEAENGTPEALHETKETHVSYKQYGWQAGLAAAFIILIAVVFIYTTMIPREVNATINGEDFTFSSKAHTVESFLEEEGIEFCEEDYLSLSPDAFIYDGISLEIKHATDFKVTADGKTKSYKSLANTVEEALDDVNIEVGDKDIVEPGLESMLTEDMEVVVKRVEIKTATVEEKTSFKTVTKDDSSLDEGTTKVVTKGVKGTDKVTYEIKYIDGKEVSRKEIKRKTVKKPVNKVVANGTRINYNGQTYSRKLVVKAYAYTGGGRTAMGTAARVGEIAVDPSVIPLGSNVYIEGVGARRAEDTGGNIKGNTIDIYMNTQSECISWGARYVTIYIQ